MNRAEQAIATRVAFDAALLQALAWSAERGSRRVWLTDPDFADWPLDAPAWIDALTSWVQQPQRRLTLIAQHFDEVPRRHPRFTQWRRTWGHAVEAFVPVSAGIAVPTVLVDDGPVLLEVLAGTQLRGRLRCDAQAARHCRDEIDALQQRSAAAFASTVLGI